MGVDTTGEVIMAEEVTMGKHNILRVHITIYPIFYFILSNFVFFRGGGHHGGHGGYGGGHHGGWGR
jgi:hypothetical protein